MNYEIEMQRKFWDSENRAFDSIYTHKKSKFQVLLDKIFRKDMYQRFEFTIENSKPIKGKTFLDVGCGTGLYSVEFAKRAAEHVVGLDISENMIHSSQKYARDNNVVKSCDFFQTDLLEFKTNSKFDVTIGIGLFDYIKEPLPIIKKMRGLTNDKLILSFPRFFTWRAPLRKVRLTLKKCDVYFYTKRRLKSLMEAAGIKKYSIGRVGKLYCVVVFCDKV
ncbi:MAG: class I SAM-dependent methyltransferase [Candidatus Scalinduaceae bacterium]